MADKKSDEVIGKLGKVADSLESATTQLTNVVTQQQLDVVRERLSSSESEIQTIKNQVETFTSSKIDYLALLNEKIDSLIQREDDLEKDFSGMRSLVLSSFALSVICLIGLILCLTKL